MVTGRVACGLAVLALLLAGCSHNNKTDPYIFGFLERQQFALRSAAQLIGSGELGPSPISGGPKVFPIGWRSPERVLEVGADGCVFANDQQRLVGIPVERKYRTLLWAAHGLNSGEVVDDLPCAARGSFDSPEDIIVNASTTPRAGMRQIHVRIARANGNFLALRSYDDWGVNRVSLRSIGVYWWDTCDSHRLRVRETRHEVVIARINVEASCLASNRAPDLYRRTLKLQRPLGARTLTLMYAMIPDAWYEGPCRRFLRNRLALARRARNVLAGKLAAGEAGRRQLMNELQQQQTFSGAYVSNGVTPVDPFISAFQANQRLLGDELTALRRHDRHAAVEIPRAEDGISRTMEYLGASPTTCRRPTSRQS